MGGRGGDSQSKREADSAQTKGGPKRSKYYMSHDKSKDEKKGIKQTSIASFFKT